MTGQTAKAGDAMTLTGEEADAYLIAGLRSSRYTAMTDDVLAGTVDLAKRLTEEGVPLPPLGVLADWCLLLSRQGSFSRQPATPSLKRYEHQILGRMIHDANVDRAAAAIAGMPAKDRRTAIAFTVMQMLIKLRRPGVSVPAASLRALAPSAERLLQQDAESPHVERVLDAIVDAARQTSEFLAKDDCVAVEDGTALMDLAAYVAHRQVMTLSRQFEDGLPKRPPKPRAGRRDTPTALREDDAYPTGGYASISTRGSMESLLHSQLAYMEDDHSPDLFDIRFVRDELYYYSRDDNRFLRKRRHYAIAFAGSLVQSRVKDREAPAQRLVLAMAAVLAVLRKLTDWLKDEALRFDLAFDASLAEEKGVIAILLRNEIQRGVVAIVDGINAGEGIRRLMIEANESASEDLMLIPTAIPRLIDRVETIAEGWERIVETLLATWI
jgi:hypothetical protein